VKYVDVNGKEDEKVLLYSYLNASYQTGMKNPLDEAIIEFRKLDISSFKKIDEIPFDYVRRRVSVVVEESNKRILITKGAFESIISICEKAVIDGNEIEISEEVRKKIENTYREISSQGFRVLGLAIK
jgi:Mg2+-importing ATPase